MFAAVRFSLIAFTLASTAPSVAASQDTDGLRVRITLAPDPRKDYDRQRGSERVFTGRLVVQSPDSVIVVQDGFGARTIRAADLTSLEISAGTRRRFGRGVVIGGLSGMVAGGVFGFIAGSVAHDAAKECTPIEIISAVGCGIAQAVTDPGLNAMVGATAFGVVGTVVGGIVGGLTKTEKWSPLQLSEVAPDVRLVLRPGKLNRVGLSLTF